MQAKNKISTNDSLAIKCYANVFFNPCHFKIVIMKNYGLTFVSTTTALHTSCENDKTSTYEKFLFLNSQTPRLRFFVLCFGFNQ